MKIKTLYVRFYKSFNYDYLRKSHPNAEPDDWDLLEDSGLFFPFVRVPMESGITTVVGANESGKSQLLGAIKCLLSGEKIEPRDFCRYSQFFTVGGEMKRPEFGGEFTDLSEEQVAAIRSIAGLSDSVEIETFHFFRMNAGPVVFVRNGTEWNEVRVEEVEIDSLNLPTYFLIDANAPLPDSVPLAYLTGADKSRRVRPRKKRLQLIDNIFENPEWFDSEEAIDNAKPKLIKDYSASNAADEAEDEYLMNRLELAEKLLVQVAGIGKDAFEQLKTAVRNHDGYANGIVQRMNADLAKALNFPKWWSQDSEFSLTLTLRDFDLVFTVRDRTGSEYAFSERSGGMSYFLSYFVQYLSHMPTGEQEILLMDEPDAYLSMLGQQDLLRIFDSFAEPEDDSKRSVQVVYVTHSPFLIDKNHSERIRVLEKGDGEEGTRLVANAGRNHYEPLRSAFGAFVAETTFISNCNLMLEGQADQILLAGISSLARRSESTGSTLNLNSLSMVPSGSAEHIPYMVYLARGRDVDTPAVVVLLDGDDEANGIREELKKGYRGRKYVDDEFVIQSSDLDIKDLKVETDAIREIEDLLPSDLVVKAIRHYAAEVLSPREAEEVAKNITTVAVEPGKKVFKAAEAACKAAGTRLRLDKVGFARAVLYCLEHEVDQDLKDTTIANFEQLFILIEKAQRQAVRSNGRERVRKTLTRFKNAFLRDHQTSALRRDAESLFEDIENQLTEVTEETERVRRDIRLIRRDFNLTVEPGTVVEDYESFVKRLQELPYGALQEVQTS